MSTTDLQAEMLKPGERWKGVLQYPATFSLQTTPGHSYSCAAYHEGSVNIDETVEDGSGYTELSITARYLGVEAPNLGSVSSRITFITGTSPLGSLGAIIKINTPLPSQEIEFECKDTTLSGDFNTNGTIYNFLEISSTTEIFSSQPHSFTAYVTIWDNTGTEIISKRKILVPELGRVDMSIHDLVGQNKYGTILIAHDGTEQSLRASVSRYAPGTTSSEPLILRGTNPFVAFGSR